MNQLKEYNKKAILENIMIYGLLLLITSLFSLPTLLSIALIAELVLICIAIVKNNPKLENWLNKVS